MRPCSSAGIDHVELVLVRHAQASGVGNEYTDASPLTIAGVLQSQVLSHALAATSFSHIISSPATRAVQTTAIVLGANRHLQTDVRLRDYDHIGNMGLACSRRGSVAPYARFARRVVSFASEMFDVRVGSRIFVCSHGTVISLVTRWFARVSHDVSPNMAELGNASVTRIILCNRTSPGGFMPELCRILTIGDLSHLPGNLRTMS